MFLSASAIVSAIQPALTIRITCILNQQSVNHINILFVSETYGTSLPGSVVEAGNLSRF